LWKRARQLSELYLWRLEQGGWLSLRIGRVKANEDASLGGGILVLYGSQSSPLRMRGQSCPAAALL
jgi:hypothetical protein